MFSRIYYIMIFVISHQKRTHWVAAVDIVILEQLYATCLKMSFHKVGSIPKKDLEVSNSLMLLLFSFLFRMVKSVFLVLPIRVPSSRTFLFMSICCSQRSI